jgi:hypothetical protein
MIAFVEESLKTRGVTRPPAAAASGAAEEVAA